MKEGKGYKKGFWTLDEDRILKEYVRKHGKGRWNRVANMTGLKRCGKSCRLRWINYLCPTVNREDFTEEEDDLIIRLHNLLGNRWALIAGRVPGRTDNQVKNHWNTRLSKKLGIINKEKNKAIANSQTLPTTTEKKFNISQETETNYGASVGATSQKVFEGGCSEGTKGLLDTLEPTLSNDGYDSSFWFLNDDFNVNAPDLVGLLGQCSPDDFVWNGF
ncbi:unnamed protein product [Ilex paraguariensis]|uniref:Uncharacterized protein n=1 Tax=Ilex paraguariensis TaxID=185542 RepID=A0ABC8TIZ2_9AQUA